MTERSSLEACPAGGWLGRGEQAALCFQAPPVATLCFGTKWLCAVETNASFPYPFHKNFQTFGVVYLFLVAHKPDCKNSE